MTLVPKMVKWARLNPHCEGDIMLEYYRQSLHVVWDHSIHVRGPDLSSYWLGSMQRLVNVVDPSPKIQYPRATSGSDPSPGYTYSHKKVVKKSVRPAYWYVVMVAVSSQPAATLQSLQLFLARI